MPVEVFISYRRSDAGGYARLLSNFLKQRFREETIFYDQSSIERGTEFPTHIRQAVGECKVLLALIARDWLQASHDEGGRRLDHPGDYVRSEIALALKRRVAVFPVLFEGTKDLNEDELPEDLKGLARIDPFRLGGKDFEFSAQFNRLVEGIGALLGVSPAPLEERTRGKISVPPENVSLLCDRDDQDRALEAALRAHLQGAAHTRPLVLVVHGRPEEEHPSFVRRLDDFTMRQLVPRWHPAGRFLYLHALLGPQPTHEAFASSLRRQMAKALDIELGPLDEISDSELLVSVRQRQAPGFFAVMMWQSSDLDAPDVALERMFDYWASFPDVKAGELAGIFLCLKYVDTREPWKDRLERWFRRKESPGERLRTAVDSSKARFHKESRVSWVVLPELEPVTFEDADRWKDRVWEIAKAHVTEYQLRTVFAGRPRLPMGIVIPALDRLVKS